MSAALACLAVAMGISPADRTVWCIEMVWCVGLWALLALTWKKFRFSTEAYGCFFVWMTLQTIGAHYTFEHVPMDWLMKPLGLVRNPYDRIAHFAVGWFAFPLAELFHRRGWTRSAGFAAFFAVMSTVAMAGIWELVEWIYAVVDGGEAGAAFLGSQGDVWDAQKDILCDTLGALCSAALFFWRARGKPDYWELTAMGGVPILNPTAGPTETWISVCASVRAKENMKLFLWVLALPVGFGMIGGGVSGAAKVLFRDGLFSRWWLGSLIAFGGFKLLQYLHGVLRTKPSSKKRKRRKSKNEDK